MSVDVDELMAVLIVIVSCVDVWLEDEDEDGLLIDTRNFDGSDRGRDGQDPL